MSPHAGEQKTRPGRRAFAVTALLAALTAMAGPNLAAQEQPQQGKRPRLGAHQFIPNPLTQDPFPRTYIRQGLGVGQALNLDLIPTFVVGGDTIEGLKGDLLFATLDLEYQQRIKDWLAMWGQLNLVGRLGTDVGAILTEGATVLTGFEIGWLLRLLENEQVALAATATVWNNNYTGINFLDWVEGVVDGEPVDLVRKTPSVRGGGGLRFAWTATDWLGVNLSGETGYGESLDRSKGDRWFVTLAGGASIDLYARTPVPIGFVLGMQTNTFPNQGSDIADRLTRGLFRIAYTGRDDFVIGLDSSFGSLSRPDEDSVDTGAFQLNLRYYF